MGEIDVYVRATPIPGENVAPLGPEGWSEPMLPRQDLLLVSVETKIDPLVGSTVILEDRSWLMPGQFSALWQVRNRRGGDDYEKTYGFAQDGVHRIRKTPVDPHESGRPPEQWSDLKESFYAYPAGQSMCTGAATPVALLFQPTSFPRSVSEMPRHMCVFDRQKLYDVLISQGTMGLPGFDVAGVEGYPPGSPKVAVTMFEPRALGDSEKKGFSFLGISGDFEVVFDLNSGIPLMIRGSVPGIGTTELTLRKVQLLRQQQ
jgi:hypothetical protein